MSFLGPSKNMRFQDGMPIISSEYVDSEAKIFLILFENSTTHIAVQVQLYLWYKEQKRPFDNKLPTSGFYPFAISQISNIEVLCNY